MISYEQREAAHSAAKAVRDAARAEGRDMTEDELATVEDRLSIVEQFDKEHAATARPSFRASLSGGPDPGNDGPFRYKPSTPAGIPRNDGSSFGVQLMNGSQETRGFASFGEFLQVLDSGRFDNRLNATGMRSDITSDGGALVPESYRTAMLDAALEKTLILSKATKFPMTAGQLHLNGWDGNSHTSRSLFGGFTAGWETELATMTEQDPKTRRITLSAKKLGILTRSSNELLADAGDYERMLGTALVDALAWELDYQLIQGTGAGRPLGIVNAGSKVQVAKESSQTAATIWFTNVLKMTARLHPSCFGNSLWLCSPSCLPQLMTLDWNESATATGSALIGDGRYMPFREETGTYWLMGRPLYVTEKCSSLGTAGDLILVDPTQIAFGMREEITVERSAHAGFTSDSTYFRAICRCDACPMWASAFTPANGDDDLSWAVTLATRD